MSDKRKYEELFPDYPPTSPKLKKSDDNNEGKVFKSDEKNEEENIDDENFVQSKTFFVGSKDELHFFQPSTSLGVLKEEQIISQASTSHTWLTDEPCSSQSNTFCAGHKENPKYNTSPRQLHEFNLKSLPHNIRGAVGYKSSDFQARLSAITDSYSGDDTYKMDPCQSSDQDPFDGSHSFDIVDIQDEERAALSNRSNEDERSISPPLISSLPICILDSNISLIDPLQVTNLDQSLNQMVDECRLQHTEASHIPQTPELDNERKTPEQSNESQPLQLPTTESDITHSEPNLLLKKHINGTSDQYFKELKYVPCCITTISQAVKLLIGEELVIEDEIDECHDDDILIPEILYRLGNGYLTISRVQEIIGKATNGAVLTKYFEANSSMLLNLSKWLNYWLKRDAVAVVTLNFDLKEGKSLNVVQSSWHYFLIHGVNPNGIQMFSPSEYISEETLKKLFLNPSESLIRKDTIMGHWTPTTTFKELLRHSDDSFKKYNVLGQIVKTIRDACNHVQDIVTTCIRVPSAHKCGILLMMHSDNVNLNNLIEADDTFSPS